MNLIKISKKSSVPKYKQIVDAVEHAILHGDLIKGDKLPSLNSIKNRNSISRDTVLIAYNDLKARGIIQSIVGKGYYVLSEHVHISQKIFLLFDELNSFKEDLYNSFINNLSSEIQVDIFFHHFNFNMFEKLISDSIGNYNYYVIMPANFKNANTIIQHLPSDKVYILDQTHSDLKAYPSIFQNFESNIYQSLHAGMDLIKKYHKIVLLFQSEKQPKGIVTGFLRFCKDNNMENEVIASLENRTPLKGEIYFVLDDKNLIRMLKKIKSEVLKLGEEVGIVSYNDTILKEVVAEGITTISTDFNAMGKRLAEMILNTEHLQEENPCHLTIRKSL
ncbi:MULTISPECIES: GntR family transcriptional regulator [unclassified Lacinutrix]